MLFCDQDFQTIKLLKILIINDLEYMNSAVFVALNSMLHYSVAEAFNFEEAFLKLQENSYDFIILDLTLPDIYAEDLVNDIQKLSRAKIIILTEKTDKQVRERLFKNGILDYIIKDNKLKKSLHALDKTIQMISKNNDNNILIIDNSYLSCKHIKKMLSIRNYKSVIALTEKEGLSALVKNKINLIILDMGLLDIDGFDLLQKIREKDEYYHIPVIIFSSSSKPELIRDCFKAGASDFIVKPFNIEEFTLKIDLFIKSNRKDIKTLHKQKIFDEYKLAIDDSTIISKADVYGTITYVNDKFCDTSGYTKEEVIGKPHSIVRHLDMSASTFKEMWKTINKKKQWNGIVKNLKKDGSIYYVQSTINPIIDYEGNIIEFISVCTDITELELIKEELDSNLNISNKNFKEAYKISQEYQKAIDESNILSRTDIHGNINYVNEKFCEISGYTQEELLGKNHSIIKHPNTPKKVHQNLWKTISSGKVWQGQLQNKAKNGSSYYVDSTIVPILDANNKITEYLGIRHDVTDIIELYQEIDDTQREIIYKMGEVGESRSQETGNHVRRVAQYSRLLALLANLGEEKAYLLYTASPMHDIGKVGIPDSILKKSGKLTDEEWLIMKTHSKIGFNILKNSQRPILQAAATVSFMHHEKWDGSGYPNKLVGDNIHIFGRITAIADVFDALGSDRVYKKAWELEKILTLFKEEKGKHFDPNLVELFLDNLDQFLLIRDKFHD